MTEASPARANMGYIGAIVAVATIGRDLQSLQAEHAIEEAAEGFTGRRLPSGTS